MSAAPYWGQLPASTASRHQTRARRMSASDHDFNAPVPPQPPSSSSSSLASAPAPAPPAPSVSPLLPQPFSLQQAPPISVAAAHGRAPSPEAVAHPQPRSNRASGRTSRSDAPTESTFSPLLGLPASPTFNGLAPRPPSHPFSPLLSAPSPAPSERQPWRKGRISDELLLDDDKEEAGVDLSVEALAASPAPPAAPDVPRNRPPLSYKFPFGNGGLPYSTPLQEPPQRVNRRKRMAAEDEYYKALVATPDPAAEHAAFGDDGDKTPESPNLDPPMAAARTARRNGTDPAVSRTEGVTDDLTAFAKQRSVSGDAPVNKNALRHQRRSSSAQQPRPADRRRVVADDRSPLQRLEKTLDSLSKEEKRARAEAAELRAAEQALVRERAVALATEAQAVVAQRQPERNPTNGIGASVGHSPPARTRSRNVSTTGPTEQHIHILAGAAQTPPPQYSATKTMDGGGVALVNGNSPRARERQASLPMHADLAHVSDLPQRNLSFRERAAMNQVKIPQDLHVNAQPVDGNGAMPVPASAPAAPTGQPSSTIATTKRRGSNKLKKSTVRPSDAWSTTKRSDMPSDQSENPNVVSTGQEVRFRDAGGPALPVKVNAPRTGSRSIPDHSPTGAEPSQRGGFSAPLDPPTPSSFPRAIVVPGSDARQGPKQSPAEEAAVLDQKPRKDVRWEAEATGEEQLSDLMHARETYTPGHGLFKRTEYLDEWKKATIGSLDGELLDLTQDAAPAVVDLSKAWWESPNSRKRRGSVSNKPRKAEAFDGEYDDTHVPTRFKPPLYLRCGPLLRFCGTRTEYGPARSARNGIVPEREIWRGSVMIVTSDADSSYDIAPTLRLFVQPIELLPPPPTEIADGQTLAPEYIDPVAGHPKLGRRGETLYVRPVYHLQQEKDLSADETDAGLFEKSQTPLDGVGPDGAAVDPPGSFAARRKRIEVDGEKVGRYKDVRGCRLHGERGLTFWKFDILVELRARQQRIAYRINRGPAAAFWVPARGQVMHTMFYSGNGFGLGADPDPFCGPDPMWRDVLNTHQSQPFHVMIGGGDQVYNDVCSQSPATPLFREWLRIRNAQHKHNAPFTAQMQDELEQFYLDRYCAWFSSGLFGLAASQIPMVNMYDDHDIIDGFGSYVDSFQRSPVFSGLGNVAHKYFLLFQMGSVPVSEAEEVEPAWILGARPGPYINEPSRSLFMFMGSKVALLALDCRTERMHNEILGEGTWKKIMDRCYDELVKGKAEHLLVLSGVPLAYPRLQWLENLLTSRLMDPLKVLGKTGLLGSLMNHFDSGNVMLDDLDDHWTAKGHKQERAVVIEDLQDLAGDKSIRVTFLSGDVHLAAVGRFFSNAKLGLPKHEDFRYMPNIISSAIANAPPSDVLADLINRRNKVHHLDRETDEDMAPLFLKDVDGKARNNKRLMPRRNWCSIRAYDPAEDSPPFDDHPPDSAAVASSRDFSPVVSPPGSANTPGPIPFGDEDAEGRPRSSKSLFRRLSNRLGSSSSRGPSGRDRSRPPVSMSATAVSGGGLFRSLSRRRAGSVSVDQVGAVASPNMVASSAHTSQESQVPSPRQQQRKRQNFLARTLSNSSGLFGRRGSSGGNARRNKARDDGGINGTWGDESDEDDGREVYYGNYAEQGEAHDPKYQHQQQHQHQQHQHQHQQHQHQQQQKQQQQQQQQQRRQQRRQQQRYESAPAAGVRVGLRGGGDTHRGFLSSEYEEGDERLFTAVQANGIGAGQAEPTPATAPLPSRYRVYPGRNDSNKSQAAPPAMSGAGAGRRAVSDQVSQRPLQPPPTTPRTAPRSSSSAAGRPGLASAQDDSSIVLDAKPRAGALSRTPTGTGTGASARFLLRRNSEAAAAGRGGGPRSMAINVNGALQIQINVEISPGDPGGITVPYRMVVPRLWWNEEDDEEEEEEQRGEEGGAGGEGREKVVGPATRRGEALAPGGTGKLAQAGGGGPVIMHNGEEPSGEMANQGQGGVDDASKGEVWEGEANMPAAPAAGGGIRRLFSLKRGKTAA